MKKTYKIILLSALIALGSFSSCSDDFLDQTPAASIDSSSALLSDNDVLTALYGAYAGLATTNLYGLNLPVLDEMLADNIYVSSSNSGYFTTISNYSFLYTASEITGIWSGAYDVIKRTNSVINSNPTITSQTDVDQYKGEAYALRALMNFVLVTHFARPYTDDPSGAGIPIVLQEDYNAQPARNTVEEVYSQILSDLDKAYELITEETDPVRFSKYAVRALQAKVNLFKGDYALALQYSEEVISDSGHELLPYNSVEAYWSDAVAGTGYSESLFEVSATQTENLGVNELAYYYVQDGYGQNVAAKSLYQLYPSSDVRRKLILVGARGSDNPAYFVNKYPHISGDIDDKVVLRVSDIYLIAAESAYRTGDESSARTYLNELVAQRDPSLVYTSAGDQLLQDILKERRKELAFEGDRLPTLNRLKMDITGRQKSPSSILYSDYRRVFPIPRTELTANPNITQNSGWPSK